MSTYRFTVDIEPIGKARPRMTRNGHVYTPKETREAELAISMAYELFRGRLIEKGVPVSLDVVAYFPIPQSWSNIKKMAVMDGDILPTKKPDADNILKLVADALNGEAYEDDAQVVDMSISKRYRREVAKPGYLDIVVTAYDGEEDT